MRAPIKPPKSPSLLHCCCDDGPNYKFVYEAQPCPDAGDWCEELVYLTPPAYEWTGGINGQGWTFVFEFANCCLYMDADSPEVLLSDLDDDIILLYSNLEEGAPGPFIQDVEGEFATTCAICKDTGRRCPQTVVGQCQPWGYGGSTWGLKCGDNNDQTDECADTIAMTVIVDPLETMSGKIVSNLGCCPQPNTPQLVMAAAMERSAFENRWVTPVTDDGIGPPGYLFGGYLHGPVASFVTSSNAGACCAGAPDSDGCGCADPGGGGGGYGMAACCPNSNSQVGCDGITEADCPCCARGRLNRWYWKGLIESVYSEDPDLPHFNCTPTGTSGCVVWRVRLLFYLCYWGLCGSGSACQSDEGKDSPCQCADQMEWEAWMREDECGCPTGIGVFTPHHIKPSEWPFVGGQVHCIGNPPPYNEGGAGVTHTWGNSNFCKTAQFAEGVTVVVS